MPPQTRNTKSREVRGKYAGVSKSKSASGQPTADQKTRREYLKADIESLEEKLETPSMNEQERELYQTQLDVRKGELDEIDAMDVDQEEQSGKHELLSEIPVSNDEVPLRAIEPTGEQHSSPSGIKKEIDSDDDGLFFSLSKLTLTDHSDKQADAVGWRWTSRGRKQIIMRLGTPQACRFAIQTKNGSFPTKDIQRVSGTTVLSHTNDDGKPCYGVDNIVCFRGVVIYTTQAVQHIYFWVQFHNLNQGLPEGLKMYKERCWETRSRLLCHYDESEIELATKTIWANQEQRYSTWYNEQCQEEGTPDLHRSPAPFPIRPTGRRKSHLKSESSRRRSKKTTLDSDSESASEKSSSERRRSSSASSMSNSGIGKLPIKKAKRRVKLEPSEDSLFVSPTDNDHTTRRPQPLRFSKEEYMAAAMKRAKIEPNNYEEIAKLEAAYTIYRHELLKQGAVEAPDAEGAGRSDAKD